MNYDDVMEIYAVSTFGWLDLYFSILKTDLLMKWDMGSIIGRYLSEQEQERFYSQHVARYKFCGVIALIISLILTALIVSQNV